MKKVEDYQCNLQICQLSLLLVHKSVLSPLVTNQFWSQMRSLKDIIMNIVGIVYRFKNEFDILQCNSVTHDTTRMFMYYQI